MSILNRTCSKASFHPPPPKVSDSPTIVLVSFLYFFKMLFLGQPFQFQKIFFLFFFFFPLSSPPPPQLWGPCKPFFRIVKSSTKISVPQTKNPFSLWKWKSERVVIIYNLMYFFLPCLKIPPWIFYLAQCSGKTQRRNKIIQSSKFCQINVFVLTLKSHV